MQGADVCDGLSEMLSEIKMLRGPESGREAVFVALKPALTLT